MAEKNIFAYKLFFSLNIIDFNIFILFFLEIATPTEKCCPLFPSNPSLKVEVLSSPPPLFWKFCWRFFFTFHTFLTFPLFLLKVIISEKHSCWFYVTQDFSDFPDNICCFSFSEWIQSHIILTKFVQNFWLDKSCI